MSADERPSKIRKLSHGSEEQTRVLPTESKDDAPQYIASNENTSKSLDAASATTQLHSQGFTENNENPTNPTGTATTQSLSKSQLKKLRKKQEWEAGRPERKAKRKEKTKEKRTRKREQREQATAERKANGEPEPSYPSKPKHRSIRLPITILIDCGFDDKMVEKERISLGAQLTRAYSDNARAPYQAHLMICSWNGQLRERFDTTLHGQYRNWKDVTIIGEDFVEAADLAFKQMSSPNGGKMDGIFRQYAPSKKQTNGAAQPAIGDQDPAVSDQPAPPAPANGESNTKSSSPIRESASDSKTTDTTPTPPPPEIIYLTSDSPHTLTTLSPNSTYIVGGLVDKNRHKGICYKRAQERGIKTAKLPIGEFMTMQSRFVLATNHVVEIMVRYLECRDWGEAFMSVIPKRKGGKLRGGNGEVGGGENGDGEEEAEGGDGEEGSEDDDVENEDSDDDGDDDGDVTIQTEGKDTSMVEAAS